MAAAAVGAVDYTASVACNAIGAFADEAYADIVAALDWQSPQFQVCSGQKHYGGAADDIAVIEKELAPAVVPSSSWRLLSFA